LTAESVTPGHPDKLADFIADTVLDAILEQDKYGRVACEVFVSKGYVVVGGEITTQARLEMNDLVRKAILEVGYDKPEYGFDGHTVGVLNTISEQSPDIAQGVRKTATRRQGAGDQGVMVGYATDETPELMPLPILLAHRLTMRLAKIRKQFAYLRPDGKSQVTIEYKNGKVQRVKSVIIAASHDPDVSPAKLKKDILKQVIQPVCGKLIDKNTDYYINNTGRFVICGPVSDTGMSGRKNVVDAYGPQIPIGGGSFSGKDPTKIDRSVAYLARYIAKNIVAADLAKRCLVRLAYVIGGTEPSELEVETFGTSRVKEEQLKRVIPQVFDLSPGGIVKKLNLLRPIYRKTTCFGHFGREDPEFTWEKKDKVTALLRYVKR